MLINLKNQNELKRRLIMDAEGFFSEWDKENVLFEGSADDFHNYATDLARFGFYGRACQVLEAGLAVHAKNTDLLADYLAYGVKCGKGKECNKYFNVLLKLSNRKQTWRSFRFSVSYLIWKMEMADSDEEVAKMKSEALSIVERAKKVFPKDETHYLSEYEVYEASGEKDEGLKQLEAFLRDPNRCAKVAPKCHLKFIDEMMEEGEYQKVLDFACVGAAEAAQEQEGVDTGYFFYLYALALDAKWLKTDKQKELVDKEIADSILTFYQTAYDTLDENKVAYFDVIRKRFRMVANLSNIDRKLNDWRRSRD